MIYAIGERARYEAKLDSAEPLYKLGRGFHGTTFYEGGSVWLSEADAQAFIAANGVDDSRSVYGVIADWETDTVQMPREPFRRLIKTSRVVRTSGTNPEDLAGGPKGGDDSNGDVSK